MSRNNLCRAVALVALSLVACDDTHYVNPNTVLLTISSDKSGSNVVEQCDFVPVLLGSQVETHHDLDGQLGATFTVTRSAAVVTFTGAAAGTLPFRAIPKDLPSDATTVDDAPPAGYSVELRSGCTPSSDG